MAERIAIPKDRVFERTQGCWNCKHFAPGDATKKVWAQLRIRDLNIAVKIATDSPQGENDVRVENIRKMVNTLDHAVVQRKAGICTGDGKTADGNPVGDLVAHSFLCSEWSGAQGASIARGGQKADELPEELKQRVDGEGPTTLEALQDQLIHRKKLIEN